jgi:catechol-2,3-dioxygenase
MEPAPGRTVDVKAQSIAAATGMGTVDLAVTDADRALRFYRDYVGLTQLPSAGPGVHMGAAGRELVVLHPGAERPVMPRTSGLDHLAIHVADVEEALRFYHDLVGFDVMGHIPGVGFVSAWGDHHHLGLNEWAGHGARSASAGSAGLRRFTVEVPTQSDLEDVIGRLERNQVRLAEEDGGFVAADPSSNRVLFKVAAAN